MKLPSFKPKELLKIFNRLGFTVDHQTGSHAVLRHPDGRRTVIPVHARELKRGTIIGIVKQAGYTPEDFSKILRSL